jgi:hypothetical protein
MTHACSSLLACPPRARVGFRRIAGPHPPHPAHETAAGGYPNLRHARGGAGGCWEPYWPYCAWAGGEPAICAARRRGGGAAARRHAAVPRICSPGAADSLSQSVFGVDSWCPVSCQPRILGKEIRASPPPLSSSLLSTYVYKLKRITWYVMNVFMSHYSAIWICDSCNVCM